MSRAEVLFRLPDGRELALRPGDFIGRTARAALRIEDPRVSEAHAFVSLRGAELKLLSLRGRLSFDGRPVSSLRLVPGARAVLAGFYALTVVAVTLPDAVLALSLDGAPPVLLDGVMTLQPRRPEPFVQGFDPEAAVTVWPDEAGVWLRVPDAADVHLDVGQRRVIDGVAVEVVRVPLGTSSTDVTMEQGNEVALTIVLHYDTVHVRPSVGAVVVFDGLAARVLTEVAQLDTPVSWAAIARTIWEGEDDEATLRQRWDGATRRIRDKLRAGRVRPDLLRMTGGGLVELFLGPADRVEDMS